MSRRSDVRGGVARASPWPILVALGLAVSELGVFLGSVPVAVAGVVLLGGASAGLARDAGYGASPVGPLLAAGGLFVVLGGGVWAVRAVELTVPALLAAPGGDGVARRGLAVLVAGWLLVGAGIAGWGTAFFDR